MLRTRPGAEERARLVERSGCYCYLAEEPDWRKDRDATLIAVWCTFLGSKKVNGRGGNKFHIRACSHRAILGIRCTPPREDSFIEILALTYSPGPAAAPGPYALYGPGP